MILELIKVIKDNGDLHISCRINAGEDSVEIAKLLEKVGADSLQITKSFSPKYFTKESGNKDILFDITDEIASAVNIPVILGGGLSTKSSVNELINSTSIDFVSMQRPFVFNPTFLSQWKDGSEEESLCRTCNNCYLKKTSTCNLKLNNLAL